MTIDRLGSVDPLKNYGKAERSSKPVKTGGSDSIEVSSEARAQAEVLMAKEAAMNAPDVRADRIAELKVKIQDPNYGNKAMLEAVAEGILKSFGV